MMSKRKATPLDADDVLAGRVKASAAELLQLIHRENPTGRELGARETEQRYARKARLQSLLVRRFADELEVALDPAQPGTVSLHHRGHGRDGCHALLASLDEDARSWVQRELDLAASTLPVAPAEPSARLSGRGAPAKARDEEDATPEGLVRRAEAAIASYDYEAARAALEEALEASHGSAGPATALLALLVETLGDDAGALAIEARIDDAALADARVRAPLALAAARSGEEPRALMMARKLDDAPAAAVLAALATSALARGDLDRAAGHLEQARRRDPACPGLVSVAGEVAAAQAKARAPAEAEIEALLAAGRDAEAKQKADLVLASWPASAAARRALHAVEERRRTAEAARLAAEAEEAEARGDSAVALARLAQAAAAARGAEREAIDERASRLEASERDRRETERVEQTIRLLQAGNPDEGLTAYLALEETLRARVRASAVRPEVGWIDRMAGGRGGDRAKVDAALAIALAREALARDPEEAVALLAPHDAWLERVPEARRIAREAEATLLAGRLSRARAAIEAAQVDLAAGAADEALARLGALSVRELPDEERAEAAALDARAKRIVDRRRRSESALRHRASGRLFEARAVAEGLVADADAPIERARWEGERDAIRASIQRSFRVEVDDEPRAAEELGRLRPYAAVERVSWWLTADGHGIVIARAYERWVLVRVLDRATMRVCPTILLRTPEPLGNVDVCVCGPTLWLTGERGALVEIAMPGWEVRDFRPSLDVAAPTLVVETSVLVATEDPSAPRYFWVASRARGEGLPERLRIIDLAQRRVVRELSEVWHVSPIAGLDEPCVVATGRRACSLYAPRGVLLPHGRLEPRLHVLALAAHPSGQGFVGLVSEPPPDGAWDAEEDRWLYVATISPTGAIEAMAKLPDADPDASSCVAAARGSGLVHGISMDEGRPSLVALATGSDRSLSPLYTVEVGGETVLVQDAGARRVVALTVHDHGVDAAELGPTPPDLPLRTRPLRLELPAGYDASACGRPSGPRHAAALALSASWAGRSDADVLRRIREMEKAEAATPSLLVEVVFALRADGTVVRHDEADRMIERLFARFPGDPEVRLLQAQAAAVSRRWAEARELLTGAPPAAFDDRRGQHLHHLRALVAFAEGRVTEGKEALKAAFALEGGCELGSLEDFFEAVSAPPGAGTTLSPLTELVAAIHAADTCFAAGDPEGAQRALDRPVVWWAHERQSLARLAETFLMLQDGSRAGRLRTLETLGSLRDHVDEARPRDRRDLPLPNAWGAERIADVAARARAWLDAQGALPEG